MASRSEHPPMPEHSASHTGDPAQHQKRAHDVRYQPSHPTHSNAPRPRARTRGLSLHSDKSDKNENLVETHHEKEQKRLHSKADPTMAMNEAEPSAVAANAKSNLQSIRALQHKDLSGNVITDPDLSNPTRWREERPLDTIRAFQAAIDGNYRSSLMNSGGDNESVTTWNRRSSYYAGNGPPARFAHDNYYGSRPQSSFRPDTAPRDAYYDQQPGPSRWASPPDRRRVPHRMGSDSQHRNRQNGTSGTNGTGPGGTNRPYDAFGPLSGTSGESPGGYQTDPMSADNDPPDRQQIPNRQPEPVNDYGIGFSQNQTEDYQASSFTVGGDLSPNGYQNGGGSSAVPRMERPTLKKNTSRDSPSRPAMGEKRKSWFKRLSKGL